MRMNPDEGFSAADWLNSADERRSRRSFGNWEKKVLPGELPEVLSPRVLWRRLFQLAGLVAREYEFWDGKNSSSSGYENFSGY